MQNNLFITTSLVKMRVSKQQQIPLIMLINTSPIHNKPFLYIKASFKYWSVGVLD